MRHNRAFTVIALLIALTTATANITAQEERRTVSARMGSGSNGGVGIQARHEPGFFTIPEGHVATGFSYSFSDPVSDYTSTRLGPANIYSVTLGRDIREAEGNPNVQLPPGEYKFVVGGHPGASGTLSFKVVSTTGDSPSDQPTTNNRRLPRDFDVSYNPMTDIYVIEKGSRKTIGDFDGQEFWHWPDRIVVRFRNGQVSSQFTMEASGEHYRYIHTSTLAGTLSDDGRFSGTETGNCRSQVTLASGQVLNHSYGQVYALSGQVDAHGLLVIHGKWQSDHGQMETVVQNGSRGAVADGNGRYQTRMEPYDSNGYCASFSTEIHLRLPIGQSQFSDTLARDHERSDPRQPSGPGRMATPGGPDIGDVPRDSIWSNDNDDRTTGTTWSDTSQPPSDREGPKRPHQDNIWSQSVTADDPVADNDAITEGHDDNPANDDERPGERLSDGRILFKPPWDEGDAYPMDEEEVKAIQKKQSEGFRWDKRYGWVDDKRQEEIDDIADIQRRNDEKEKATRDFLSGQTDSLNARVLDDVAEAAAEKARQNVNYAVGRTTRPGYDATLGQPVKDAVDWSAGGEEPHEKSADPGSSDDPE